MRLIELFDIPIVLKLYEHRLYQSTANIDV